jgi:U5 small nuclear ribonucleoprotein component
VNDPKLLKTFLETKYDWDILASSNVWAFGPETYGTNALINDSLPTATNQEVLSRVRQSVVQGFRWSTR